MPEPYEAGSTLRCPYSNIDGNAKPTQFDTTTMTHVATHRGFVSLVGAGPGDPLLLTLRGYHCLQQADVVLYDYLVNPIIATWAPAAAETICLGQHGHSRIWTQAEIHEAMRHHARLGRRIVRLKGGDPAIFARGGEEVEFLQQEQISFEVVPGITAALAAGGFAGIPLTHRKLASAVAFVTGHEHVDAASPGMDYAALARFPGTLVVYMGVTTAHAWVPQLLHHGMSPDCPVALVRRCSLYDQQVVRCRLADVPQQVTPYKKFPPPVIAIIGDVASLGESTLWLESRPLHGQSVLVTRAEGQAADLCQRLAAMGAGVYHQPAIRVRPPHDWQPVDHVLSDLASSDWIVFTSANGVEYFLRRLWERGLDPRALATARLATIGPGTAQKLESYRLRSDMQPDEQRAEALAESLLRAAPRGRFLLVRGSRSRNVLPDMLRAAGAQVESVTVYQTDDIGEADPDVMAALEQGRITWTMVSSPAIAQSLHRLLGERLKATQLVSISPRTTQAIAELGYVCAAEARTVSIQGMIEVMCEPRPDAT